jgi:hypothetical protein
VGGKGEAISTCISKRKVFCYLKRGSCMYTSTEQLPGLICSISQYCGSGRKVDAKSAESASLHLNLGYLYYISTLLQNLDFRRSREIAGFFGDWCMLNVEF